MKKAFTFLFVLNCWTISLFGQTTINTQKIDSLITVLETNNVDIGAVSIFQDGKQIYNRSFNHNVIEGNKANEKLKYHIGSITKLFTATMIFQLIEEKKLKLTDKLASYFPEMPNAKNISIANLLEHSSGLGDFRVKQDSLYYWLRKPVSKQEIFDEIKRQGILFQAGDSVSYSNSGYYLLARILEKERGKPYNKVLTKNITSKLDLTNTHSISKGENYTKIAQSYKFDQSNKQWHKIKEVYFPNIIGIGDMISTPKELNVFINALFSGKLISKESLKKMKPAGNEIFGKGIMRFPFDEDISLYGHGGTTVGTQSIVAIKDDISISYVLNGVYYPNRKFALGLLSIIFNKDYEIPSFKKYEIDPETYYLYTGIYSDENFPFDLKIFKENNLLKAKLLAPRQGAFIITPYAENKFQNIKIGVKMNFSPKKGELVFKQGGRQIVLTKEK